MRVDCSELIRGHSREAYCHEYDSYMVFFRLLGFAEEPVECVNVPSSWTPLVAYLGHEVVNVEPVTLPGWEFESLEWLGLLIAADDKRRVVEIASACRPELVHALYCADTEWPCLLRVRTDRKAFVVTCNGSFFRDEVRAYRRLLDDYYPEKSFAVLTPCSAEKPYPSALHRAIQSILPSKWQVIVATGVLGLAPDDLWSRMPEYDSGLPYIERVAETVAWYFSRHRYNAVVVYSDFYAYAVKKGFDAMGKGLKPDRIKYVLGNHYRDTYENLLLPEHLHALERAVVEFSQ